MWAMEMTHQVLERHISRVAKCCIPYANIDRACCQVLHGEFIPRRQRIPSRLVMYRRKVIAERQFASLRARATKLEARPS